MNTHACIWLSLLLVFTNVAEIHAGQPQSMGPEEFSFFKWGPLHGLNAEAGGWDIHVGGQAALDAVAYDSDNVKDSGLRWKRLNPLVLGAYESRFFFHLEPDVLGVDTKNNLYEAWAGWNLHPAFRLKAGQIKVALNTEFATRPENFPSFDYGFTSYLDGRYDLGLQIDGSLWSDAIWYEASGVVGEGFDLDGNRKSEPQFSIRTVVSPLIGLGLDWLKGTFVGLSYAYSPDYDDKISLDTPLNSNVFSTADLDGESAGWLRAEVGWHWGPFRMGAERVEGAVYDVKINGGDKEDFDQLNSWSAYGSWFITGQRVRWNQGRWLPPIIDAGPDHKRQIFDFLKFLDPLGGLEIAFRYANADIDRNLFDLGFTDYSISSQEVRTATLNLNWYPKPGLRISGAWVKTIADDFLNSFEGTNRDSSFALRAILTF